MKKILLSLLLCSSLTAIAQHPTDKGWRSVGGTGRLYLDIDGDSLHNNVFSLSPEVYWFVGNSFGLGTDFGFSMNNTRNVVNDSLTTSSQSISMWVTPGFRFYFREPEKAWRPYMLVNGGFGYNATRTKVSGMPDNVSKGSGFRGYGGMGVAWFFSDHAAFDIRYKMIDYNIDNLYFNPEFMIGVQAFFD